MDWVRGEKLGNGSFGTVNLALLRNRSCETPPLMAVKSCGLSLSGSLMNEKLVLDELKDCPEIIRCFGENFTDENGEKLYNVLLEYASGGALADKVRSCRNNRLPESEVRRHTKALLKGLDYIHKFGYVHCDIKLQNILLGPNGGVKIADFGLAKRIGREKVADFGCELRGTPLYMSPEMVTGKEQGPPSDIWALGCTVAEMASGAPPWRFSGVVELLMRIGVCGEAPEIPSNLSSQGKDFLEKCFVNDPSKRWTAEMLLDHPFVDGRDFDDTVTLKERCGENDVSTSPRCPFDFPDWTITSLPSVEYSSESDSLFHEEANLTSGSSTVRLAERLQGLVSDHRPHWHCSDDWLTIR